MDFFDLIVPNDVTHPCSSSQPARQTWFSFLFSHPSSWDKSSTYLKVKDSIDRLSVVNDAAERESLHITKRKHMLRPKLKSKL